VNQWSPKSWPLRKVCESACTKKILKT
jgi:hypothetical protein